MLKFILLTIVVLLFVPGIILSLMFILMINGANVDVQSWLNTTFALTIAAELYGIIKVM